MALIKLGAADGVTNLGRVIILTEHIEAVVVEQRETNPAVVVWMRSGGFLRIESSNSAAIMSKIEAALP
jgi:hypothetical protein